ncbi:unnamed protein product, partial [Darwinula stevensoni]
PVGCDGEVGSELRLDECGVCGGDNSTCRRMSGFFSLRRLPPGYNFVARIPAASCLVNVTQIAPTPNLIALKESGAQGKYILNGDWKASEERKQHRGAGTVFYYGGKDSVVAPGPIATAVDLFVSEAATFRDVSRWALEVNSSRGLSASLRADFEFVGRGNPLIVSRGENKGLIYEYSIPAIPSFPPDGSTGRAVDRDSFCLVRVEIGVGRVQVPGVSVPAATERPHASTPACVLLRRCSSRTAQLGRWRLLDDLVRLLLGHAGHDPLLQVVRRRQVSSLFAPSPTRDDTGDDTVAFFYLGYQTTRVACMNDRTRTVIADWLCDSQQKPTQQIVACNNQPCPPQSVEGGRMERMQRHVRTRPADENVALPTGDVRWDDPHRTARGLPGSGPEARGREQGVHEASVSGVARGSLVQGRARHEGGVTSATMRFALVGSWCNRSDRADVTSNIHDRPLSVSGGGCSATCGEGTQEREVKCLEGDASVVDPEKCGEDKPESHRHCQGLPPCARTRPVWLFSEWISNVLNCTCDGQGEETRDVVCLHGRDCDEALKPNSTKACESSKCHGAPQYAWFTGPWSHCSLTCGGGVKERKILCLYLPLSTVTEDEECDGLGLQKPPSLKSCKTRRCPPRWFRSQWSDCSVKCGIGEMKREVQCLDEEYDPSGFCNSVIQPPHEMMCSIPCTTPASTTTTLATFTTTAQETTPTASLTSTIASTVVEELSTTVNTTLSSFSETTSVKTDTTPIVGAAEQTNDIPDALNSPRTGKQNGPNSIPGKEKHSKVFCDIEGVLSHEKSNVTILPKVYYVSGTF